MVGNKSDLVEKRAVSLEEVEKYAKDEKLIFLETSAKNSNNVETAFMKMAEQIKQRMANQSISVSGNKSQPILAGQDIQNNCC